MANYWLQHSPKDGLEPNLANSPESLSYNCERKAQDNALPDFLPPIPTEAEGFQPGNYFIPGWVGNSLFSKQTIGIKKLQEKLWEDAMARFKQVDNLPRSLSLSIHQEFLAFFHLNDQKKGSHSLETPEIFWKELKNIDSTHRQILDDFSELYSFRVATNYLSRLKFLITFSKATGFEYSRNHIINPSTFSQMLFRKGSSQEIVCEAFRINQYSWYRPSSHLANELEKLTRNFYKLSITQMMKLSSFRNFKKSQRSLNFENNEYSHALSHRTFGQFINQLLIFFPIWQKQETFDYPRSVNTTKPEIYNTKFVGENIESLSQSHWLAQEVNMSFSWSEIICPEFSTNDQGAETFIKLGQELQFLTFLVQYAQSHNINARELVTRVTREKYSKTKNRQLGQFNLFSNKVVSYDRVVLNIGDLPKKNPHHFLLTKIQEQKDELIEDGYLIVLSNQKLFVPSQSKKVAALLKDFKVEANFNFEKLKAKGEVSNYVYILSKRNPFQKSENPFEIDPVSLTNASGEAQESCYTFRIAGELSQFGHFEGVVKELLTFFKTRSSYTISMLHRNISPEIQMEFHQDAIIEGKLLSSLGNDRERITHPHFFKNLTKSCVPLEKFFNLMEMSHRPKENLTNNFLGINNSQNAEGKYILIVDLRDPLNPAIEICTNAVYAAKRQDYGDAYFYYYSMTSKVSHLNLNLLREFLDSSLGAQIVQICLSGGAAKLKGKLRSLLIPRFFGDGHDLQGSPFEASKFLSLQKEDILSKTPGDLQALFNNEMAFLEQKKPESLWAFLSILCHFKILAKQTLEETSQKMSELSFNNPMIKDELIKLDTVSVYPNDQVFTELLIDHKDDLERTLSKTQLKLKDGHSTLEVYHEDDCLIKFHAEKELLLFIDFILSQAAGYPILGILQNLQVPKVTPLKEILDKFNGVQTTLSSLLEGLNQEIKQQITKEIAQV
jgi:hypothetical protein